MSDSASAFAADDSDPEWNQLEPAEHHIATPEQWSDVGAVRTHVALLEQQVRMLQTQVSDLSVQLAHTTQGLQQLDINLTMQKQQHQEDIVKIMAAHAMTLSNLTSRHHHDAPAIQQPQARGEVQPSRPRARPGPRERQRMRHEEILQQQQVQQPRQWPLETVEPDDSTSQQLVEMQDGISQKLTEMKEEREKATDLKDPREQRTVTGQGFDPHSEEAMERTLHIPSSENYKLSSNLQQRTSIAWFCVVALFFFVVQCLPGLKTSLPDAGSVSVYGFRLGLGRERTHSQSGQGEALLDMTWITNSSMMMSPSAMPVSLAHVRRGGGRNDAAATVRKLRELGHLRLAVSDCAGALRWFTQAVSRLNASAEIAVADQYSPEASARASLLGDRGFALVCAGRLQEGIEVLEQVLPAAELAARPPHLVNALGYAHFQQRHFARAREVFQAIAEAHPENPVLWSNLGAASMSAGDIGTADEALYHAMTKTGKLKHSSEGYYKQVFSNNVHALRGRVAGLAVQVPAVEIFNCIATDLSELVTSTDVDGFRDRYETLSAVGEDVAQELPRLLDSRSSVLALEREPRFCP